MFCDRMDVQKPISVFRYCETFLKNFLSKGSPFNVFDILQQIGCLKIPKGPLSVFRHFETSFRKFVFSPKGPPFNRQKCWQFRKCPSFSAPRARSSGPRRATRSIFLVFWFSSTVNWHLEVEVLLLFLSLGYGADLVRCRLVFRYTWSDQNSSTKSSTKFYIVPVGPGNWTKQE